MPRKKPDEADRNTLDAAYARWRLLVRHPEFLRDLRRLRRLSWVTEQSWGRRGPDAWEAAKRRSMTERERVADKWGLLRIPPQAINTLNDDPAGLEMYGRLPFPIDYSPVALTELRDQRFLFLRVDTTKPLDHLLASLEAELRAFYKTRPRKRGRPDSLDLQLAVFDQIEGPGEKDFRTVARTLRAKMSTVRSAYVAACQKIGKVPVSHRKTRAPVPHPGPIEECPNTRCRTAARPEDFCDAHRAYCMQDQVSCREYLGPYAVS